MPNLAHATTLVIESVALMTLVVFVLSVALGNVTCEKTRQRIMGLVLGALAAAVQNFPLDLGGGSVIDPRCLIVGISAGFFGWRGMVLAIIPAVAMRIQIGGIGVLSGSIGIVFAALMGLGWRQLHPYGLTNGTRGLLLLGVMISAHLLTPLFFLPPEWIWAFYRDIGLPLGVSEIIGALIFGTMIRREKALHALRLKLDSLAHSDPLTGLPNRRSLKQHHVQMSESGKTISILYIDIDHFKPVNDAYGHAVGDAVLCEVAQIMLEALPERCCLARLGGEEFAAILCDLDEAGALHQAETLRQKVAQRPIRIGSITLDITISIGVHNNPGEMGFYTTLQWADRALYLAKSRGRNQIVTSKDVGGTLCDNVSRPNKDAAA